MATRATYQIESGFSSVTFYIHHDGYFEGAALYFRNTLDFMRVSERSFLPCFLWANERAELTAGHEAHGDTEYRYDLKKRIDGWVVTAHKRQSYDSDIFEIEWSGNLADFVNKFNPKEAA